MINIAGMTFQRSEFQRAPIFTDESGAVKITLRHDIPMDIISENFDSIPVAVIHDYRDNHAYLFNSAPDFLEKHAKLISKNMEEEKKYDDTRVIRSKDGDEVELTNDGRISRLILHGTDNWVIVCFSRKFEELARESSVIIC